MARAPAELGVMPSWYPCPGTPPSVTAPARLSTLPALHHNSVRLNWYRRPTGLPALQATLLIVEGLVQFVRQHHLHSASLCCKPSSAVFVYQAKTDTMTAIRQVSCCRSSKFNTHITTYNTIHAPGCVDLPVVVTTSTPGAVPWVTPPASMRMAMTCVCRPMTGTPFSRGMPASLALLKAASRAAAFANRDGFVGVASPTGPASAHHHMSRHANMQKLPGYQGCGGCNSLSLQLSSYSYTTPVHTILHGSRACSKSRLSVMHRAVSANPFEPIHIWKLYI
jgi:hypothetical protein